MSQRDIIWLTLESIRWDHTSLSDHCRDTTPQLKRIVNSSDACSFNNCHSHGIWTRSSSASILTGMAPSRHGVGIDRQRLPEEVETIPEKLRQLGYRTAGVSSNVQISPETSARGFDNFHYLSADTILENVPYDILLKYGLNLWRHSVGLNTNTKAHSLGYIERALSKREITKTKEDDRPLFLYTHIGDSHHPYYPPNPWQKEFESDLTLPLDEALNISMDMSNNILDRVANGINYTDDELYSLEVLYDSHIKYVDHLVGDIVSFAKRQLDNPIIVITADHGELFGEQNLLGHRLTINSALTNVPLVLIGCNNRESISKNSDSLLQHADAMQTVLDSIDVSENLEIGQNIGNEHRKFVVSQLGIDHQKSNLKKVKNISPEFESPYPPETVTMLKSKTHTLFSSESCSKIIDSTTRESVNEDEIIDKYESQLEEWLSKFGEPISDSEEEEFSTEVKQRLQKLGYVAD
ncbi:Arylsulfatase A [Haladaptatus litoreus]|uniref:Arylsulfatase A n=1 Tax=Haladaptatus litoreus TaxID=553468 RepID=A0A1N7DL43_9EURY|nr:sulfatase-like hydrolase/transferase [Haladaptatus litoreus]SIR76488.1 Arylsulfatase A [Haladaptatus litoreus]